MARAFLGHHHVARERFAPGLEALLKRALEVGVGESTGLEVGAKLRLDERPGDREAPVQVEGGDHRLVGVRPERRLRPPSGLLLAACPC